MGPVPLPDLDSAALGRASGDARPGTVGRRAVLAAVLGGSAVGSAVAFAGFAREAPSPLAARVIADVEAGRRRSGATRTLSLAPARSRIDLGGRVVDAYTYGGTLPGPPVRVGAGDVLSVEIRNGLAVPTSVHWHGLAIRNDADGVPGMTAPEIAAGESARVEFVVPDPGTYWFHPHSGLQLDWGLYAPLIVDDPHEAGDYDEELVVVLDDWSPGLGATPEKLLADLRAGSSAHTGDMDGMAGMTGMAGMSEGMSDAGDVAYPAYLANGRLPTAPTTFAARPGQRVRLRMINASADTTFDVALGGHPMTVTHSDGFPVQPVGVGTVRISMGERYDAVVTLRDGVFPLTAVPLGKTGLPARVLLRTGAGTVPAPATLPEELRGRRLSLTDLVADISVRLPEREPDTVQDVVLGGDMASYRWTVNGRTYDRTRPLRVRRGRLTRLRLINRTMMLHPVHLHGHTFAVRATGARVGHPRKDTVLVPAMGRIDVDVLADNPGAWMLHCHNAFHMEAGMMTRLDYVN
jgi:FtsP/CotA-like multicopper oxidase with cupredoxin domain